MRSSPQARRVGGVAPGAAAGAAPYLATAPFPAPDDAGAEQHGAGRWSRQALAGEPAGVAPPHSAASSEIQPASAEGGSAGDTGTAGSGLTAADAASAGRSHRRLAAAAALLGNGGSPQQHNAQVARGGGAGGSGRYSAPPSPHMRAPVPGAAAISGSHGGGISGRRGGLTTWMAGQLSAALAMTTSSPGPSPSTLPHTATSSPRRLHAPLLPLLGGSSGSSSHAGGGSSSCGPGGMAAACGVVGPGRRRRRLLLTAVALLLVAAAATALLVQHPAAGGRGEVTLPSAAAAAAVQAGGPAAAKHWEGHWEAGWGRAPFLATARRASAGGLSAGEDAGQAAQRNHSGATAPGASAGAGAGPANSTSAHRPVMPLPVIASTAADPGGSGGAGASQPHAASTPAATVVPDDDATSALAAAVPAPGRTPATRAGGATGREAAPAGKLTAAHSRSGSAVPEPGTAQALLTAPAPLRSTGSVRDAAKQAGSEPGAAVGAATARSPLGRLPATSTDPAAATANGAKQQAAAAAQPAAAARQAVAAASALPATGDKQAAAAALVAAAAEAAALLREREAALEGLLLSVGADDTVGRVAAVSSSGPMPALEGGAAGGAGAEDGPGRQRQAQQQAQQQAQPQSTITSTPGPFAAGLEAGGGALATARAALLRHPGGFIPRIIHQIYGLYDAADAATPGATAAAPAASAASLAAAYGGSIVVASNIRGAGRIVADGAPAAPGGVGGGGGGGGDGLQHLPPLAQRSVESWRRQNPGHTHVLWGAADVDAAVRLMFPAFAAAWDSPSFRALPVLRADLARYLLVFAFGGVYADTDTLCLKPIDTWTQGYGPGVSAIVGVEADAGGIPGWWRHWGRQLQFCQWAFAAEPAHPLLAHVVFRISELLEAVRRRGGSIHVDDVTGVTGPTVMTDAVYEYLRAKGRNYTQFFGLTTGVLVGDGSTALKPAAAAAAAGTAAAVAEGRASGAAGAAGAPAVGDGTPGDSSNSNRTSDATGSNSTGGSRSDSSGGADGVGGGSDDAGPATGGGGGGGDLLLVLPITAFSPGVGHMGAGPVTHPEARVQHLFGGSWKKWGATAAAAVPAAGAAGAGAAPQALSQAPLQVQAPLPVRVALPVQVQAQPQVQVREAHQPGKVAAELPADPGPQAVLPVAGAPAGAVPVSASPVTQGVEAGGG